MARLESTIQRSFGQGEIAPALAARADLQLYNSALRTCRNFIPQRHGGAYYRNGSVKVAKVKTGRPYLLKYAYNAALTFVLEIGAGYIRFFQNEAPVLVSSAEAYVGGTTYAIGAVVFTGGSNYWSMQDDNTGHAPASSPTYWYAMAGDIFEMPSPFLANLDLVRITQDLSVATLTHQDYPPQELSWLSVSVSSWRLAPVTTTPSIAAPVIASATPGAAGALNPAYVVTSRKLDTYEESLASAPEIAASAAAPTEAAPNVIVWGAVTDAIEYRVYCDPYGNGTFGYLATAQGVTTFNDPGFAPDFNLTPPRERVLFANAGEYPHTAAYYQQRRLMANSHLDVSTVWASQTGFPSNYSIRSPLQDDDAVTFTLAGPRVKGIQHLVALERLIAMTDGAEWIVLGDESSGVLTPFDIHPQEKGWSGSAARPVPSVIGSTVIFTQYLSKVVRDLVFNETYTGFQSRDLTIFAAHLFAPTIIRQDVQIVPDSVAWFVRGDGILLGLTYLPDLEQYGWHRHDTAGGTFLDVCVIPEGETPGTLQDYVYVLVERASGTYIERFAPRLLVDADNAEDLVLVDSAVSYSGASTTAMTGLSHLNGEVVYAWTKTTGGNIVQGPFTVSSGAITLTTAATKAQIGLRITGQLETLPIDIADLRAKKKRIQAVNIIVERSVPGFFAGPDSDHLYPVRREMWKSQASLSNDRFDINLTASFHDCARVLIQHALPSPLTVLGIIPQIEVGG